VKGGQGQVSEREVYLGMNNRTAGLTIVATVQPSSQCRTQQYGAVFGRGSLCCMALPTIQWHRQYSDTGNRGTPTNELRYWLCDVELAGATGLKAQLHLCIRQSKEE
jgi:hypothetical protein